MVGAHSKFLLPCDLKIPIKPTTINNLGNIVVGFVRHLPFYGVVLYQDVWNKCPSETVKQFLFCKLSVSVTSQS